MEKLIEIRTFGDILSLACDEDITILIIHVDHPIAETPWCTRYFTHRLNLKSVEAIHSALEFVLNHATILFRALILMNRSECFSMGLDLQRMSQNVTKSLDRERVLQKEVEKLLARLLTTESQQISNTCFMGLTLIWSILLG